MTESLEDYLEVIYLISLDKKVARVTEISDRMKVKKPSVINAIKELEYRNFIVHEKYGYILLTDLGEKEAKKIYSKHLMLKNFLINILNVPEEIANIDACKMEHNLSAITIEKIKNFMQEFKSNMYFNSEGNL